MSAAFPAAAQNTLSLHDAIQQAMESPLARITDAQVEEAQGGVRQAGLGLNPRLFLQSEDLRPWDNHFDFPTQTENYGYVGQTFESAGKRRKRIATAQARLHLAQTDRTLQMRDVAGRVMAAYWIAVSSERIAQLLRDDLAAVDEMVRYHKERVDAGATRGVDLIRTQIERDRIAMALASSDRDRAQAKLELFRQIGKPAYEVHLGDRIEDAPVIPPIPIEVALQQRPDVQAAREAIDVAEADVTLQKANGAPDPDLLAGYKRNSGANTGYIALQLPLSFRNRNQGEIERARASVTAAQQSFLLLQTQVRIEIEQAQQNYQAQQKIVRETVPDMRARAKQNLEIVTEAYRIGGVDLLRFLDAERTEFDVEVSAVRTLAQLQQAAVQLQLAYGVQP